MCSSLPDACPWDASSPSVSGMATKTSPVKNHYFKQKRPGKLKMELCLQDKGNNLALNFRWGLSMALPGGEAPKPGSPPEAPEALQSVDSWACPRPSKSETANLQKRSWKQSISKSWTVLNDMHIQCVGLKCTDVRHVLWNISKNKMDGWSGWIGKEVGTVKY